MNTFKKIYSSQAFNTANNEHGYVTLVTVLGALLLLTVVSLSMISTSINDQQIVRNNKLNKRAFYLAESGANEAAQQLENAPTTLADPIASLPWVQPDTSTIDFADKDNWRNPNTNYTWFPISIPSPNFYALAAPLPGPGANQANSNMEIFDSAAVHWDNIHIAARFIGVAAASSTKVTTTTGRLYAYYTLGMYSSQINLMGESLIEEGYRKRF